MNSPLSVGGTINKTLSNICDGDFLQKSSTTDVCEDPKYSSRDVLMNSKISEENISNAAHLPSYSGNLKEPKRLGKISWPVPSKK